MMNEEVTRLQAPKVDVMIRPDVGGVDITDFTHKKELMEAGRAAAEKALPQIKALLNAEAAKKP